MPLFPTVDLQNLSLKSAKSLLIKTIQEGRSNETTRIKFITGDEDSDQESVHSSFPIWVSDPAIKNYIENVIRQDGTYMILLKTSDDDDEPINNINTFQQKALDNDGDAQLRHGMMYHDGEKDNEQDDEQELRAALKWLKKSAEQGDVNAQRMVANLLQEKKTVRKNDTDAIRWLMQAATENDDPDAQYNIGLMYLEGNEVTRDVEEAYRWLKRSATKGHSEAQLTIGNLLYEGKVFEQDIETAIKLFRMAAKQNNVHAQMIMGEMYIKEQNDKKALKWIKMAADLENADAQYMLGQMYAKGKGVRQDFSEAIKWFKRAAEQGHYEAGIVSEALS